MYMCVVYKRQTVPVKCLCTRESDFIELAYVLNETLVL